MLSLDPLRVLLIGGAPMSGKTTLAHAAGDAFVSSEAPSLQPLKEGFEWRLIEGVFRRITPEQAALCNEHGFGGVTRLPADAPDRQFPILVTGQQPSPPALVRRHHEVLVA